MVKELSQGFCVPTGDGSAGIHRQKGFTLMELTIVSAIIMILAVILIPNLNGFVIENKVPKIAEEMQRFIARAKIQAQASTDTIYGTVNTAQLANSLRGSSVFRIVGSGTSAYVTHDIGRSGALVTLSPGSISEYGDAMLLTFQEVNRAACPSLATLLQKISDVILVNGNQVKAVNGSYQPTVAETVCTDGDTNQFEFTIR